MPTGSISIVSGASSPSRVNEDGWLALELAPDQIVCAVIDGASVRITLPSLTTHLRAEYDMDSPAAWATGQVRTSLMSELNDNPEQSLREALKKANDNLRSTMTKSPSLGEILALLDRHPAAPLSEACSGCSVTLRDEIEESFAQAFPDGRWRQLDTRHLRLALPVCVATVVRLNLGSGCFDFVHVGDTALMQVDAAGSICLVTRDQMGVFDDVAIEMAASRLDEHRPEPGGIVEAFHRLPVVQQANLLNGLRHNYVTKDGRTQPDAGCGALNGLAELDDYIQVGDGRLISGEWLYLMSDGLMLPLSPYDEEALTPAMRGSLAAYHSALKEGDLAALYRVVRELEGMDPAGAVFLRLKTRDDATGIAIGSLDPAAEPFP